MQSIAENRLGEPTSPARKERVLKHLDVKAVGNRKKKPLNDIVFALKKLTNHSHSHKHG